MRQYIFEVLPDGSIGARYFFDAKTIPAQPIPPGSTHMVKTITGRETAEEMQLINEARTRPQKVRVRAGKLEVRELNERD